MAIKRNIQWTRKLSSNRPCCAVVEQTCLIRSWVSGNFNPFSKGNWFFLHMNPRGVSFKNYMKFCVTDGDCTINFRHYIISGQLCRSEQKKNYRIAKLFHIRLVNVRLFHYTIYHDNKSNILCIHENKWPFTDQTSVMPLPPF